MSGWYRDVLEWVGLAVDGCGVLVIVAGISMAAGRAVIGRAGERYANCRQDVGRAVLLGLEFLVAGDIIRTVAIAPTLENVGVLGAIVLIRTFLSFSLEMEVYGRSPAGETRWERARQYLRPREVVPSRNPRRPTE